jgi:hypothetical protein
VHSPKLLFGPAPILEEEDAKAYDDLLAHVSSAVKPPDFIGEIWVCDVVDLTWEILRWRRLKINLVERAMVAALQHTLAPLMPNRPAETGGNPSLILDFTPGPPSPEYELARKWAAGSPAAVDQVKKLMSSANVTMETVMARAFMDKLDDIERIDRFITIAEGRRNAVLREIDRRRSTFAHSLRETVQNVEEADFKIIESKAVSSKPKPNKNAA